MATSIKHFGLYVNPKYAYVPVKRCQHHLDKDNNNTLGVQMQHFDLCGEEEVIFNGHCSIDQQNLPFDVSPSCRLFKAA